MDAAKVETFGVGRTKGVAWTFSFSMSNTTGSPRSLASGSWVEPTLSSQQYTGIALHRASPHRGRLNLGGEFLSQSAACGGIQNNPY
jgi:hypothetical protein